MQRTNDQLWARFQAHYAAFPSIDLGIDISRMNFPDDFFQRMEGSMQGAFAAMKALEEGAIANPDEKRMVGHYWLRNSGLAPSAEIRNEIDAALASIREFVTDVHEGRVRGANGRLKNLLVIGIGGSALGPQFVSSALGNPITDKLKVWFFDNTDPDGMDRVLADIGTELGETLVLVISKSGGTKETRNGMLEARAAYERGGLSFGAHAVAITGAGSELDRLAGSSGWLRRFPMWDWVGGRTSELSAVGLLPAALQGFDIEQMLSGARACDTLTRNPHTQSNPAALLALMWFHAGQGHGAKDMVILPYKDRLELFSKYLQQLIMESLGKERDVNGRLVNQGIAVYGNKGSTDQHAYVQQLRDGLNNFFVTFLEVLSDREGSSMEVEPGVTSGDFLSGFLLGTRQALFENGRESLTITTSKVSPFTVGVLIALYERAVGLYATLVGINAYHQPGVEAGKLAAGAIIALQKRVVEHLKAKAPAAFTADELAGALSCPSQTESVFKVCQHLAANARGIRCVAGPSPTAVKFQAE